jgi:hypothetical protein
MFTFVETPLFTRLARHYLDDEDDGRLQAFLDQNPESGAVVPGSAGVRRMRWRVPGTGKRGGLRVIYYLRMKQAEIWMLTIYRENVRHRIPAHVLRRMKEAIEDAEQG